jgi:hypothetical protein
MIVKSVKNSHFRTLNSNHRKKKKKRVKRNTQVQLDMNLHGKDKITKFSQDHSLEEVQVRDNY